MKKFQQNDSSFENENDLTKNVLLNHDSINERNNKIGVDLLNKKEKTLKNKELTNKEIVQELKVRRSSRKFKTLTMGSPNTKNEMVNMFSINEVSNNYSNNYSSNQVVNNRKSMFTSELEQSEEEDKKKSNQVSKSGSELNSNKAGSGGTSSVGTNRRSSSKKNIKSEIEYGLRYWENQNKLMDNTITTTKYTIISFLPKSLFYQFRRAANIYFLIVSILTCLEFSPKKPSSMIGTFAFVLIATMVKEFFEDYNRYKQDRTSNERLTERLEHDGWKSVQCSELRPGNIVRLRKEEEFSADCLIIQSSNSNGYCYIDTKNLDGESNLKEKTAIEEFKNLITFENLSGKIKCDSPNENLHTFEGTLLRDSSDKTDAVNNLPLEPLSAIKRVSTYTHGNTIFVSIRNLILKGCTLKNTAWAVGLVIYAGKNTKIMKNSKSPKIKVSRILMIMNVLLYSLFAFTLAICLILAGLSVNFKLKYQDSLEYVFNKNLDTLSSRSDAMYYIIRVIIFFVAYSNIIPISLYVALEMVKIFQGILIFFDNDMYDEEIQKPASCRATDLIEELGQVEFIFSDKTGTLTQNVMILKKCYIDGELYGCNISKGEHLEINYNSGVFDFRGSKLKTPSNYKDDDSSIKVPHNQMAEDFKHSMNLNKNQHEKIDEVPELNNDGNIISNESNKKGIKNNSNPLNCNSNNSGNTHNHNNNNNVVNIKSNNSKNISNNNIINVQSKHLSNDNTVNKSSKSNQILKEMNKYNNNHENNNNYEIENNNDNDINNVEAVPQSKQNSQIKKSNKSVTSEVNKLKKRQNRSSNISKQHILKSTRNAENEKFTINGDPVAYEILNNNNSSPEAKRKIDDYFTLLSLCHSVFPEQTESAGINYQGSSPDDIALVKGAAQFGYVFEAKDFGRLTISNEIHNTKKSYDLLVEMPFDSDRKRMSVIVKESDTGRIRLFSKGADTIMCKRINWEKSILVSQEKDISEEEIRQKAFEEEKYTNEILDTLCKEGLRCLVLGQKDINEKEFEHWFTKYSIAQEKGRDLSKFYNMLENDMYFTGVTAIEDKLQEGVDSTISCIMACGVRIWVLTGDKEDTALEIGKSCKLIQNNCKILKITNFETVEKTINQLVDEMKLATDEFLGSDYWVRLKSEANEEVEVLFEKERTRKKKDLDLKTIKDHIQTFSNGLHSALIIDGHCLEVIFNSPCLSSAFFFIAASCNSVICCRVSPKQKSKVVKLAKRHGRWVTLSIGDGANDVPMIMEAHIGVGIQGKEGTQAVRSSDFSIGQFRFLEKLLLEYGRNGYIKISNFICYYFYKNILLCVTEFFFSLFNGFSGQIFFADYLNTMYNAFFTSWPCLFTFIFEKTHSLEINRKFPILYQAGPKNVYFNMRVFWSYIAYSILHSALCFYIPFYTLQGIVSDISPVYKYDLWYLSTISFSLVVHVATYKLLVISDFWNIVTVISIASSLVFYYVCLFILSNNVFSIMFQPELIGIPFNVYKHKKAILIIIFAPVICMLPDFLSKQLNFILNPNPSEYLRTHQKAVNLALSHETNVEKNENLMLSKLSTIILQRKKTLYGRRMGSTQHNEVKEIHKTVTANTATEDKVVDRISIVDKNDKRMSTGQTGISDIMAFKYKVLEDGKSKSELIDSGDSLAYFRYINKDFKDYDQKKTITERLDDDDSGNTSRSNLSSNNSKVKEVGNDSNDDIKITSILDNNYNKLNKEKSNATSKKSAKTYTLSRVEESENSILSKSSKGKSKEKNNEERNLININIIDTNNNSNNINHPFEIQDNQNNNKYYNNNTKSNKNFQSEKSLKTEKSKKTDKSKNSKNSKNTNTSKLGGQSNNYFNIINFNINTSSSKTGENIKDNPFNGLFNMDLINNKNFVNSSLLTNITDKFKSSYFFFNDTFEDPKKSSKRKNTDNKNDKDAKRHSAATRNRTTSIRKRPTEDLTKYPTFKDFKEKQRKSDESKNNTAKLMFDNEQFNSQNQPNNKQDHKISEIKEYLNKEFSMHKERSDEEAFNIRNKFNESNAFNEIKDDSNSSL